MKNSADIAGCPIEVELQLVDGRPQVVLYVTEERLAIVLEPSDARSLAADLLALSALRTAREVGWIHAEQIRADEPQRSTPRAREHRDVQLIVELSLPELRIDEPGTGADERQSHERLVRGPAVVPAEGASREGPTRAEEVLELAVIHPGNLPKVVLCVKAAPR